MPVGRVRGPKGLDPRRDLRGGQVPPAAEELLEGGDGATAGRVGSEAAEFGEFLGVVVVVVMVVVVERARWWRR